jgi:hypothetical protein
VGLNLLRQIIPKVDLLLKIKKYLMILKIKKQLILSLQEFKIKKIIQKVLIDFFP